MKNKIALIFSTVSIILSITAIVIVSTKYFPRTNLGFDYLGLIVGILGMLVTILIGWDIYKAVSIDKVIKKNKEAAECGSACLALAQLGLAMYRMKYNYQAITALVNALAAWQPHTSELGDKGGNNAQELLCRIFTEVGEFKIDSIAEELYILRSVKNKLTNTQLLFILDRAGI